MWKRMIFCSLLFVGCQTQEDIQRDQKLQNLQSQIEDRQSLYSTYTDRIQALEERLSGVTGKVEESEFERNQKIGGKLENFEERIKALEESLIEIKETQKAQGDYIKKVLDSLEKMSKKTSKASRSKKKSPFANAMSHYRSGRYKTAKQELLELVGDKKLNADQRANVLHNLGMIAFMDKEDDKALVYFSKLFTQYPKSAYIRNGLLFLGKTFQRSGQTAEAKETFNQLISEFPKTRQGLEAKKILKTL